MPRTSKILQRDLYANLGIESAKLATSYSKKVESIEGAKEHTEEMKPSYAPAKTALDAERKEYDEFRNRHGYNIDSRSYGNAIEVFEKAKDKLVTAAGYIAVYEVERDMVLEQAQEFYAENNGDLQTIATREARAAGVRIVTPAQAANR